MKPVWNWSWLLFPRATTWLSFPMLFNFYKFIVAAFGNVVNSISEMEIFSYRKKEFYFLVCDFHIAKGQNKSLMNDLFNFSAHDLFIKQSFEAVRCQFHQHFKSSFLIWKCFVQLFFYLRFGFVIFWRKNSVEEATHKMLLIFTTGRSRLGQLIRLLIPLPSSLPATGFERTTFWSRVVFATD